jgi:flagellar FliL protein
MGIIYEIRDVTVNTYASQGRRFVVVEMALETHESAVIDELKNREPQIRDLLIKYLRSYTAEQILDLNFQEYSREKLMDLINQRLSSGKVDSLYYTMLVVQ